jgi:hypothetical protein
MSDVAYMNMRSTLPPGPEDEKATKYAEYLQSIDRARGGHRSGVLRDLAEVWSRVKGESE